MLLTASCYSLPNPRCRHLKPVRLDRARRLLRDAPLVDGHNDLPWAIREDSVAPRDVAAYDLRVATRGHTDLERLARGQVGAQFWSVYVPGEYRDSGYARMQLEQIDIARQVIARYPERLALALTAADIERRVQARAHRLAARRRGRARAGELARARSGAYYELGVRYLTLTHNVTLDWADAALDSARHNGLSPFGREVVREMNRLGMLVDLSHVSPAVMSQALDVSEAPVIFSHSAARALVDHPRNVPDSILARHAANGGVVMVTFVPAFVSAEFAAWDARKQAREAEIALEVTDVPERARRLAEWERRESASRGDAGAGGRPHRSRAPRGRRRPRRHRERFRRHQLRAARAGGRVDVSRSVRRADPAGLERRAICGSWRAGTSMRALRGAEKVGGPAPARAAAVHRVTIAGDGR